MTQKTTPLNLESLAALASTDQPPCLSLYQPTHRRHPENKQDRIRFRNLVKEMEGSLRQTYPAVEAQLLLKPFEELAQRRALLGPHPGWTGRAGRAAPLSRLQPSASGRGAGRRGEQLSHQAVAAFPSIGRSLPGSRTQPPRDPALRGQPSRARRGRSRPGSPADDRGSARRRADRTAPDRRLLRRRRRGSSPMHHGHGGKTDEVEIDAERFFRAVDRAVLEHYSRPSGLPLILAALPEHHHLFHRGQPEPAARRRRHQVQPRFGLGRRARNPCLAGHGASVSRAAGCARRGVRESPVQGRRQRRPREGRPGCCHSGGWRPS